MRSSTKIRTMNLTKRARCPSLNHRAQTANNVATTLYRAVRITFSCDQRMYFEYNRRTIPIVEYNENGISEEIKIVLPCRFVHFMKQSNKKKNKKIRTCFNDGKRYFFIFFYFKYLCVVKIRGENLSPTSIIYNCDISLS